MRKDHLELLQHLRGLEAEGKLEGIFEDIPIQVYHAGPGVSSTTLKKCFLNQQDNVEAFRFGNAFHTFVNEPHLFKELYEVGATRQVDNGKIFLTYAEFDQIQVMQKKLFEHPVAKELLTGAQFELTFYVRDSETGLLKKCRADSIKAGIIGDLKTTRCANEYSFMADCRKYLYRLSAAYYSEIITEVVGSTHDDFRLIPVEKAEPWGVDVFKVHPDSLRKGKEEARFALRRIAGIQSTAESRLIRI